MLAFETRDEQAVHYLFEPDSFAPLAQVHTEAVRGVKVPRWSQHRPYDSDLDPLRKPAPEPSEPTAVYYYHTDHLGTPQALTDEQGALALEMDYQAWGQAREIITDAANKAGIRNPFRFQGQYQDQESGLHYNRHRYYDPEIGRFISRDPIGLMGGINIHSYAPNPVEWVDPFGLSKASSSAGRKQASDKPNQNAKCPCRKKWEVNRFDRVCAGNVPGVCHAKYLRDPSTGMWWSEDQTGHGNSAWKVFDKNGTWVADADVYGDYMNKHKSEVGKNINFNSLKCKDSK
ncbi:RHS repeat domain-containing protein [Chromobacterium haemolyticum]|uniref:RHS repeat domain-containing protein n=1 Tax=Chromobacterium haemolyticum TaxID=394935 RepID=UPI0020CB510B|nr:RHS repeat-associated core domain-containing protein [Chromobacterium haemolyticum]